MLLKAWSPAVTFCYMRRKCHMSHEFTIINIENRFVKKTVLKTIFESLKLPQRLFKKRRNYPVLTRSRKGEICYIFRRECRVTIVEIKDICLEIAQNLKTSLEEDLSRATNVVNQATLLKIAQKKRPSVIHVMNQAIFLVIVQLAILTLVPHHLAINVEELDTLGTIALRIPMMRMPQRKVPVIEVHATTVVDADILPGIVAVLKKVNSSPPVSVVVRVAIRHVIAPRIKMCAMIVAIQAISERIAQPYPVKNATHVVRRAT